jgi:hypothetical protein
LKSKRSGARAQTRTRTIKDPVIYFMMTIATDTDTGDLISQVVREWHRVGGVCLQIKELQTFESETI